MLGIFIQGNISDMPPLHGGGVYDGGATGYHQLASGATTQLPWPMCCVETAAEASPSSTDNQPQDELSNECMPSPIEINSARSGGKPRIGLVLAEFRDLVGVGRI